MFIIQLIYSKNNSITKFALITHIFFIFSISFHKVKKLCKRYFFKTDYQGKRVVFNTHEI